MKQLLESWNRFLDEGEEEEKYFGINPEEIPGFKELRNGNQAEMFSLMQANGFKRIGRGGYRLAYAIPGVDDIILKISWSNEGPEQNKKEANNPIQTEFSDIVPKIYEAADDYFWIKQEKVVPMDKSGMEAEEYFQMFFPRIHKVLKRCKAYDDRWKPFDALMLGISLAANRIEPQGDNCGRASGDKIWKCFKQNIETLGQDVATRRLAQAHKKYKIEKNDIHDGNIGYVVRNGKKQFVILDFG